MAGRMDKLKSKRLLSAPSFRLSQSSSRPTKNNAIAELIDATAKNKGFKQLAGYSIKCLQGLLLPGRMGWELQSRVAFEHGGPHVVLDVCLKYCTDADLLRFGVSALRSMVSAPGVGAVDEPTLQLSVELLRSLTSSGGGMGEGDTAAALTDTLDYMHLVARRSGAAVAETDVLDLLQSTCARLAGGWGGGEAAPALAAAAFRVVYVLTLTRSGLLLVAARGDLLSSIIDASLHVFGRSPSGGGIAATAGGKPKAGPSPADNSTLRAVLDPVLRLVDKLSRVEEGMAALQGAHAVVRMLPLSDWLLHAPAPEGSGGRAAGAGGSGGARRGGDPAQRGTDSRGAGAPPSSSTAAGAGAGGAFLTPSVVLDLANRLVGSDGGVERLLRIAAGREAPPVTPAGAAAAAAAVARMAAPVAASYARAAALATRQQAARLLARIAEIPVRSAALARELDVLEAAAIICEDCIRETDATGASAADLMVPLALLAVLLRVGERGPAGVTAILASGMLPAALDVLTVALGNEASITSDSAAAAALRLLHMAVSAGGDWTVTSDGATLVIKGESDPSGSGDPGLTVREYVLGYDAGEAGSPASLAHRFGRQVAPPGPGAPSLLRLLLAGVLSSAVGLGMDVPGTPTAAGAQSASRAAGADLPAHAARLSLSFFALNLLKECVFAAKAAPGEVEGRALGALTVTRGILRPAAAALGAAAAVYVSPPPPGSDPGLEADVGALGWLARGSATLAVQLCVGLADDSGAASTLIEASAAAAVAGLLQGFSLGEDESSAGGPGGHGALARSNSSKGKGLRRQASSRAAASATSASGAPGSGSPLVTLGASWMYSVAAECPSWAAASVARPTQLAADSLYLAASLMAFMGAHTAEPADAGRLLSPAVLAACAPLAAAADIERPPTGHAPADCVQSAMSCLLQAALVTYALYPRDAGVYANFREMVDVAGVTGEEVIAAVETVRGAATVLRAVVLESPTRASAVTGSNAAAAAMLKSWSSTWDHSDLVALDASDKEGARAAEAAVRARLPAGLLPGDFLGTAWYVSVIARQKLLLLEAISLSPFLSWGIVAANGPLHMLRCAEAIGVCLATYGDLDANRLARSPSSGKPVRRDGAPLTPLLLAGRLDDTLSHATSGLAHLARVAYEVRQSGRYTVEGEEEDRVSIGKASGCDKRLVPEVMYGQEVSRIMCAIVPVVLAGVTGLGAPAFNSAATTLMSWLAAAATLQPLRPDPGLDPAWRPKYVTQLLHAEFVEAGVALLRAAVSELQAAGSGGAGEEGQGLTLSADATEAAFDSVTTLFTNLQYLAVASRDGAEAIVMRGATRQVLRAMPLLLSSCGGDRSSLGYRALVAALKLLSAVITSGGAGGESSVGGLLQKQGLVDAMVGVVFSPVGITSGAAAAPGGSFAVFGEACALAVAIVSAVATRKDVVNSVTTLYEVCGAVSEAVNSFVESAQAESEAWLNVAAAGGWTSGTRLPKRTALALGDLSALAPGFQHAGEGGGGEGPDLGDGGDLDDGDGPPSGSSPPSASVLVASIQLFALLISTEAGRRAGPDLAAQGIAGAMALAQSAHTYVIMAARVQEAVTSAVSAVTAAGASAEGGKASGASAAGSSSLPAGLASAAAAALCPPPKPERDLAWAGPAALQATRLATASLLESTGAPVHGSVLGGSVGEGGEDAPWERDPVSRYAAGAAGGDPGAAQSAEFLQHALSTLSEGVLAIMDTASSTGVYAQMAAAASGLLAGTVTGGAGGRGRLAGAGASGAGGSMPSGELILAEAAAALALAAGSIHTLAAGLPSALEGRGIDVCLAALRGGGAGASSASAPEAPSGSGHTRGPGSSFGSPGAGGSASRGSGGSTEHGFSVEVACHALCALNGLAQSGGSYEGEGLAALAARDTTTAVLGVLGDVLTAAATAVTSAQGAEEAEHAAAAALLVGGATAGFHLLAALVRAGGPGTAGELASGGGFACLTTALGLCGEGASGAGAAGPAGGSGPSAGGSGSSQGSGSSSTLPPRPPLLRSLHLLLLRLARSGGAMAFSGPEEPGHCGLLRGLLARSCAVISLGAKPYLDSVPGMVTFFAAVLTLGGSPPPYPQTQPPLTPESGTLTVAAILAEAPRILGAVRRAMANSSATPLLLHTGRLVIALLGGGEEAGPEDAAEDSDEVLAAVNRAYSLLDVLHAIFEESLRDGPDAPDEATRCPQIEEGLDALRTLNLLIQPHFPVRMEGEAAAALAASLEARLKLRPTAATVWQIFATARDFTTAVSGLLGSHRAAPGSPRITALLYDVTSACLPVVSRLGVYAETARQEAVAAYWAGTRGEWELDPGDDAPLGEVVSTLGQALAQHTLALQRSRGRGMGASGQLACPYVPTPTALEGIGKTIRNIVSGAGHEALTALASSGVLAALWRLAAGLRGAVGEGGFDRVPSGNPAAAVADAEVSIATLSTTLRSLVEKASSELALYCSGTDGDPREVGSVLPSHALAEILRASVLLAMLASGGSGGGGEEHGEDGAGEESHQPPSAAKGGPPAGAKGPDAALRRQLASILASKGGETALVGVLEETAAGTLGAATLAAPLSTGGGAVETRVALKLYAGILGVLGEKQARAGPRVEPSAALLRGLYGSMVAAMAVLAGDPFSAALHASAASALYRDVAVEEHGGRPAYEDSAPERWGFRPGAALLPEQEDRVEEV